MQSNENLLDIKGIPLLRWYLPNQNKNTNENSKNIAYFEENVKEELNVNSNVLTNTDKNSMIIENLECVLTTNHSNIVENRNDDVFLNDYKSNDSEMFTNNHDRNVITEKPECIQTNQINPNLIIAANPYYKSDNLNKNVLYPPINEENSEMIILEATETNSMPYNLRERNEKTIYQNSRNIQSYPLLKLEKRGRKRNLPKENVSNKKNCTNLKKNSSLYENQTLIDLNNIENNLDQKIRLRLIEMELYLNKINRIISKWRKGECKPLERIEAISLLEKLKFISENFHSVKDKLKTENLIGKKIPLQKYMAVLMRTSKVLQQQLVEMILECDIKHEKLEEEINKIFPNIVLSDEPRISSIKYKQTSARKKNKKALFTRNTIDQYEDQFFFRPKVVSNMQKYENVSEISPTNVTELNSKTADALYDENKTFKDTNNFGEDCSSVKIQNTDLLINNNLITTDQVIKKVQNRLKITDSEEICAARLIKITQPVILKTDQNPIKYKLPKEYDVPNKYGEFQTMEKSKLLKINDFNQNLLKHLVSNKQNWIKIYNNIQDTGLMSSQNISISKELADKTNTELKPAVSESNFSSESQQNKSQVYNNISNLKHEISTGTCQEEILISGCIQTIPKSTKSSQQTKPQVYDNILNTTVFENKIHQEMSRPILINSTEETVQISLNKKRVPNKPINSIESDYKRHLLLNSTKTLENSNINLQNIEHNINNNLQTIISKELVDEDFGNAKSSTIAQHHIEHKVNVIETHPKNFNPVSEIPNQKFNINNKNKISKSGQCFVKKQTLKSQNKVRVKKKCINTKEKNLTLIEKGLHGILPNNSSINDRNDEASRLENANGNNCLKSMEYGELNSELPGSQELSNISRECPLLQNIPDETNTQTNGQDPITFFESEEIDRDLERTNLQNSTNAYIKNNSTKSSALIFQINNNKSNMKNQESQTHMADILFTSDIQCDSTESRKAADTKTVAQHIDNIKTVRLRIKNEFVIVNDLKDLITTDDFSW